MKMKNIEYSKVIAQYLEDMRKIGINKYIAAPPIYYLFWKLKFHISPPLYQKAIPLYILVALEYIIPVLFLYAVFDFFLGGRISISQSELIKVLIQGLVIGIGGTAYYKYKAIKHKHTNWKNYIFSIQKSKLI